MRKNNLHCCRSQWLLVRAQIQRWGNASLALGPRWWFWALCCIYWELEKRAGFGL